ncbi:hypothetical protein LguiA_005984 [Lonicera macranthoides]
MAKTPAALIQPLTPPPMTTLPNPKQTRVCFSFAAYAKKLIHHLNATSNIPIVQSLTDLEFSQIQSTFNFTFPPDLRSILREGLPVGPGFPNWRSSSLQQLQILINLPIMAIIKQVSKRKFWLNSWGTRPVNNDEAVILARFLLKKAPVLVPIYRHFYIPATPCLAGNPVFYINGSDFKIWSFDISGFFLGDECFGRNEGGIVRRQSLSSLLNAPAWAATEARRVEFWTEVVEARGETRGWWSGDYFGGCLEELYWRLRDGGWKEEDVREMMMMDGGDRPPDRGKRGEGSREGVVWHVRVLSTRLLRAGWSMEDVVDSLGFLEDNQKGIIADGEAWHDFQRT